MVNDSERGKSKGGEQQQQQVLRRNLDLEVSFSSAKRPRTLVTTRCQLKGKEKIEEINYDETEEEEEEEEEEKHDSSVCGICFSEDGQAVRGRIDCCNHYFCFICIMEWSKVESRCPMCKRRFSIIQRPPKHGVFPNERIFNVPVRDQAWHLSGDVTSGQLDPYAQVNCSICHGSQDENLLLLCDLCDSAAHSYCVGLGSCIPDGDWYCHDCTVCRNDHRNSQTGIGSSQCLRDTSTTQVAGSSVSVYEIIREPHLLEVDQCQRNSQHVKQLFSPARGSESDSRAKMDPNVRTFHHCPNVEHIRSLRKNWNALRCGSLNFSSNLPCPDEKNCVERNSPASYMIGQPHSLSDVSCSQSIKNKTLSCGTLNNKSSCDVDKAWKMMNMARKMQQNHEAKAGKINVAKVSTSTSASRSTSKGKIYKEKGLGNVESEDYKYHDLDKAQNMHESKKSEKQESGSKVELSNFCKRSLSTNPPQCYENPSFGKVQRLAQTNICHSNSDHLTMDIIIKGIATTSSNGNSEPACVGSSKLSPGGFYQSWRTSECGTTSSCTQKLKKEKYEMDKIPSKVGVRKDDGIKSEVQSLVKLNLKLLNKDKKLDVNEFKEVARLATHNILAACGLEHRKSSNFIGPKMKCKHSDQSHLPHMSNLMASSCRKCFYFYVKDVVCSIMAERVAASICSTS